MLIASVVVYAPRGTTMEGDAAAKQGPPKKNHSTKKGTQLPCDPDWGMMKQWTFRNRGPLLILAKESSDDF